MEFTGKWQGSPSGNCGKSDGNPKEMTRSSSGKLWGIWWNFKEMVGCSRGVYGGNQRKMVVGAPGGALPKTTETTKTNKNNQNHQNHQKPPNLMETKGNGKRYPREAVGDLMGLKGNW